ncbi:unnamed protein product [Rotaria socialis]|uniref:Uncharacterized protein n=1 Tax=Rotaria socialis TaxID=392032 RepID=A0A819Z3S7_9BILA|nr:unnamed protein product [Rotaria socialis]CAF3347032.1 unnamed protein product [Rotaria socialis]CAF4098134.1 unnamed protein product [Rotaria socialis]CAF4164993.1 unnamed protein product [Rotaria socialis]
MFIGNTNSTDARKRRNSSSVYEVRTRRKSKENILDKRIQLSGRQLNFGIVIGVSLTIVTIVLQCVAFFTPNWKVVSPKTHSLYVDGVDALIRTEILVYFNSVHRFTRHSYGLFQRCEYHMNNSSKIINEQTEVFHVSDNKQHKKCTKNFLPSYANEKFDMCHSLYYYRFCSQSSETKFDINNEYLRAGFDISSNLKLNIGSKSPCNCKYPVYVKACHVLGVLTFISLFLTALLFGIFPCLKNDRHHLKIKCFGVLSSLFSMIFIFINLLVISNHLEYESIEYFTAIERHYRSTQIYKLSQDTKVAIERFLSSITIETGYSTVIAWIVLFLSIVDGILLMITCKISHYQDDIEASFIGIPMDSPTITTKADNDEYKTITTPLASSSNPTDCQDIDEPITLSLPGPPPPAPPPAPPPPPPPPVVQSTTINNTDEQSQVHSYSSYTGHKQYRLPRVHFDAEV